MTIRRKLALLLHDTTDALADGDSVEWDATRQGLRKADAGASGPGVGDYVYIESDYNDTLTIAHGNSGGQTGGPLVFGDPIDIAEDTYAVAGQTVQLLAGTLFAAVLVFDVVSVPSAVLVADVKLSKASAADKTGQTEITHAPPISLPAGASPYVFSAPVIFARDPDKPFVFPGFYHVYGPDDLQVDSLGIQLTRLA